MTSCPYCGKGVRPADKFCLYCGEPLLAMGAKAGGSSSGSAESKESSGSPSFFDTIKSKIQDRDSGPEDLASSEGSEELTFNEEFDIDEPGVEYEEEENQAAAKKAKGKDAERIFSELDPAIKEEIEARIELSQLAKKIKKVNEKLGESIAMMDEPDFKDRYDYDDEFREQYSVRFEALKQIAKELKEKKNELEGRISPVFNLTLNNQEIVRLKQQIELLDNSFRMKKIDKNAYSALHEEYTQKLRDLVKERDGTNLQLEMWMGMKQGKINGLKGQIKLLKGRKSSREMTKEQFTEGRDELQRQIDKLKEEIDIIKKYIYKD